MAVSAPKRLSLHLVGVLSGLAAGAALGAAEAPNKLASVAGVSPFVTSLCMVAGVFTARWTVPTLLKGTKYVFADLGQKKHLIVWAVIAGALWAVANTLSIYAIRDVGLSIAFPLWNINSLVGVFWGWLFFGELRKASFNTWAKVVGGTIAIVGGAIMLAYASTHQAALPTAKAGAGIAAALGAALMWGTMYITYRKAYISGMNPLSFVTVFVFGELGTMFLLATAFFGGVGPLFAQVAQTKSALLFLFLGGFCWVIGDMFQQYATKYIGISRGIPLSNTNQLWGLAWGGLVFGELAGGTSKFLVLLGSLVMIVGAAAISTAAASSSEQTSWKAAAEREAHRYGLSMADIELAQQGEDPLGSEVGARHWFDGVIVAAALGVFAYLASFARVPTVPMDAAWMFALLMASTAVIIGGGIVLHRTTKFS
jgi:glucose uptake protein GlcU